MSKLMQRKKTAAALTVAKKASPQERQRSREKFLTMTDEAVAKKLDLEDLDDEERAFLAICQQIYREEHGSSTPFHEFIVGLVQEVQWERYPTPDSVREALKIFDGDWEGMREDAPLFVSQYPEACKVAEKEEAS